MCGMDGVVLLGCSWVSAGKGRGTLGETNDNDNLKLCQWKRGKVIVDTILEFESKAASEEVYKRI